MNYPVWETTYWGGGTWIAFVAVLHVYIAHLAVGGGLFIWLSELKAWRENDRALHDYLRRHVWFFLYLTMVFGGVSGVGIWFIISLVNPAATSLLIHHFVFGWAIEWVFFLGEVSALLLYAYRFDRIGESARKTLAFFYALFAWLSLVVINGILSFMLTPGKWLITKNFWDGFLNPTFFPSLFLRTFMACVIAGLFGYVTALRIKDGEAGKRLVRYCTKWLVYPLPAAALSAAWYFHATPASSRITAFSLNPQSRVFVYLCLAATIVLFLAGILMSFGRGRFIQRVAAGLVIPVGLGWIGGFEYVREIARKPFVIGDYLYVNGLSPSSLGQLDRKGILPSARWVSVKSAEAGSSAAGRELFNLECLSCHTVGGVQNDVLEKINRLTYTGIIAQITGQGKVLDYMPPFAGTGAEKEALAKHLAGLAKKGIVARPEPAIIKQASSPLTVRDASKDEFVLLAWSELGMHCLSDGDQSFVLLPPANTLEGQLIKRGHNPEIVGEDKYELTYRVEPGFENPSGQSRFWDFVESAFRKKLPRNTGLAGLGMAGSFRYNEDLQTFEAKWIPVVPYPDGGGFNPYPTFHLEAKDRESGKVVAQARVVAGVSSEMGCRNCHGGGWRKDRPAGLSEETARNILLAHDRLNKTDLYRDAVSGKPRLCQSCHADPVLGGKGKAGILNFSAAMHGWHANYVNAAGSAACNLCHPSDPKGKTRCLRGIHAVTGLTCTNCHGTLSDHALSLLKGQESQPAALRLMKNLAPVAVTSTEEIHGRTPWINEPDCLSCHEDFNPPSPSASGYNRWTKKLDELYRNRTGNAGIRCAACHGATHAEYPALNPYVPMKDDLIPLEYTGRPYPIGSELGCETCHLKKMEDPVHHENMARPFRNKKQWEARLMGGKSP